MPYYYSCDDNYSCSNTKIDEQNCGNEMFVCNKHAMDQYVSNGSKYCNFLYYL